MKRISEMTSDTSLGILLIGEPGGGKTWLSLHFPGLYVLDLGLNLASAVEGFNRHYKTTVDPLADQPVSAGEWRAGIPDTAWPRCAECLDAAIANPDVRTICVDDLTRLGDVLTAYVIKKGGDMERPITVGGEKMMSRSLYQPYGMLLTRFVMALRASGKTIIVISHVRTGDSELTDQTMWQPSIVGAMRGTLPALFTDYWLADTEQVVILKEADKARYPTGVKYFVRTAPRPQIKLKNSLGLPATFEFTWSSFTPYLRNATTECPTPKPGSAS